MSIIRRYDDTSWSPHDPGAITRNVESVLEGGSVLWFPDLPFTLLPSEMALLDPGIANGKSKNISLRDPTRPVGGSVASPEVRQALHDMMVRYRECAHTFVERLFPHYRGRLVVGNTSFRPVAVSGRETSWRKDDTRLHVDAFPSNPSSGRRLLRVFHNLNPHGKPRVWRLGEPFEALARRHVAGIPRPWPGSAWLLHQLRITKRPRSEYDHLMLHLHDRAKADAAWQSSSSQECFAFPAGSTWVVYSDQVVHAAMEGQFMIEQTLLLNHGDQVDPSTAPLRVLERLTGRSLVGGQARPS